MVYVGDDIFDIGIMNLVKYKFCPQDSPREVRNVSDIRILRSKSGENCLTELYEHLFYMKLVKSVTVEEVEALDRNEKF
jgi:3-deoxy-D-manno-octulosonate 8-phosphate phosphatase KdsC-like HAD superfamily phosphatase